MELLKKNLEESIGKKIENIEITDKENVYNWIESSSTLRHFIENESDFNKKKSLDFLKLLMNLTTKSFGKESNSDFLKKISLKYRESTSYWHSLQQHYDMLTEPTPEWFDHYCDQFHQFRLNKNPLWVERGIFGLLSIKQGADILEICSGDGFNAYHFYSIRAKSILSVDFDVDAIRHAKKYNQASNVEFRLCDIRTDMPVGQFDNVLWDGAMEHFTEEEIDVILKNIKSRLKPGGVLSGYTIVELPTGLKSLSHHEREFKSKEDLMSFFEPYFKNIKVFETIYPSRHNLYFYASDSTVPFDDNWDKMVINNK